jgi:hypothetical protein
MTSPLLDRTAEQVAIVRLRKSLGYVLESLDQITAYLVKDNAKHIWRDSAMVEARAALRDTAHMEVGI